MRINPAKRLKRSGDDLLYESWRSCRAAAPTELRDGEDVEVGCGRGQHAHGGRRRFRIGHVEVDWSREQETEAITDRGQIRLLWGIHRWLAAFVTSCTGALTKSRVVSEFRARLDAE
jgi:hypothetical protein